MIELVVLIQLVRPEVSMLLVGVALEVARHIGIREESRP
jgi:hypothetical protein